MRLHLQPPLPMPLQLLLIPLKLLPTTPQRLLATLLMLLKPLLAMLPTQPKMLLKMQLPWLKALPKVPLKVLKTQ